MIFVTNAQKITLERWEQFQLSTSFPNFKEKNTSNKKKRITALRTINSRQTWVPENIGVPLTIPNDSQTFLLNEFKF